MEIDVLRRARIAGNAFWDIANWRQVLPRAAAGEVVTEIRLRRGPVIAAKPENALWPHFSDIWYHRSYTKHCPIPRGSVVVDIGANVGVFSLFAARTARLVYALEPSASNFSLLTSNTSRTLNIVPLNLACSRSDGRASLDVSSDPVSFRLAQSGRSTRQEIVDVISLGTLFEHYKIERCDFLKLDCEGCEFEIILHTEPSLMLRISCIVMEYHDHLSDSCSHRDLLKALREFGFRAVAYNPKGTQGMIAAVRA
jgi:FkbM family methyltransferase